MISVRRKGGERGRNRTFNLGIKSPLLCQLSYAPSLRLLVSRGAPSCLDLGTDPDTLRP